MAAHESSVVLLELQILVAVISCCFEAVLLEYLRVAVPVEHLAQVGVLELGGGDLLAMHRMLQRVLVVLRTRQLSGVRGQLAVVGIE